MLVALLLGSARTPARKAVAKSIRVICSAPLRYSSISPNSPSISRAKSPGTDPRKRIFIALSYRRMGKASSAARGNSSLRRTFPPRWNSFLFRLPSAFPLRFSSLVFSLFHPCSVAFPATLATLFPRFEGTPVGVDACYTVRQERQDRKITYPGASQSDSRSAIEL